MERESVRYYEFGSYRLDTTERSLRCGNKTIPLAPKIFDTLLVLLENSGRVMDKKTLIELLWPDTFVEESSLSQTIFLLRKALGDLNSDRQYIKTVPKLGYRFIADVKKVRDPESATLLPALINSPTEAAGKSDAARPLYLKRRGVAVITLALLLISIIGVYSVIRNRSVSEPLRPGSIAVLPFKVIGANEENDLLGLGMADALIMRLSQLDQTRVLPTSSVFKYSARDKDALAIGRDLGVDAVIDGTLQRHGDRVRITAQLIRLSDGKTMWSGTFDEKHGDIFVLQDSISGQLVSLVAPSLSPRIPVNRSTQNPEAYEAYINGLYFWSRRNKENLIRATAYLKEAVQKDPNFAPAHALLADCYYLSAHIRGGEVLVAPEVLVLAEAAAKTALELDQNLAEAHAVRASLLACTEDLSAADHEFQLAMRLNPNLAVARLRYSYFLFANNRLNEALAEMKRAQELDPVSPTTNVALGWLLMLTRDYDNAIRSHEKALELQPDHTLARVNLGETYVLKGMLNEALNVFSKLEDYPEPAVLLREQIYAYSASGRQQEARRLLTKLLQSKGAGFVTPYEYMVIYAALGENDQAFKWLERVDYKRLTIARLRIDPQVDPLRGDIRFADYLERAQSGKLGVESARLRKR
jgi:TolB-like protein/DNA-binding winged helix-turn-helix (wHTH) protein/thioredoxin-like negative regulator of GroEL